MPKYAGSPESAIIPAQNMAIQRRIHLNANTTMLWRRNRVLRRRYNQAYADDRLTYVTLSLLGHLGRWPQNTD